MENPYENQQPDPIDTTRGKPVYTEEDPAEEYPVWKDPKKYSKPQPEDYTSENADDEHEVVKVGKKVLPKGLARMQKGRQNSR